MPASSSATIDPAHALAVRGVLEVRPHGASDVTLVAFGDDATDEDLVRALGADGVTIRVGQGTHPTAARFRLSGSAEARQLLSELAPV